MLLKISFYLMVALYLLAGLNHFVHPVAYRKIMPPGLPFPAALVVISGVCEILFALLLLPAATRPFAAWCIIALLIAVFPANIQMAINYYKQQNPYVWLAVFRLFLQPVLILWAYRFTKPFVL